MGSLVDAIVDTIVLFRDHFIIKRHLTLTEGFLFLLSFVWGLWFAIYGVRLGTSQFDHWPWEFVFGLVVIVHALSFTLKEIFWRAWVASLHAFIWGVIAILASMGSIHSPATPTFFLFALASLFLAIRMFREGADIFD